MVNQMPGYVDMMEELNDKFPLSEPQIVGEQNQKDFIALVWCNSSYEKPICFPLMNLRGMN